MSARVSFTQRERNERVLSREAGQPKALDQGRDVGPGCPGRRLNDYGTRRAVASLGPSRGSACVWEHRPHFRAQFREKPFSSQRLGIEAPP